MLAEIPYMKPARTSVKPGRRYRTTTVRRPRLCAVLVWSALAVVSIDPVAAAGSAAGVGTQQRQQAEGWLQLKQDQQSYRERVGPITPGEAVALDALVRQQRLQRHALEQRQRQSLQLDQHLDRLPNTGQPGSSRAELRGRSEIERQRLQMRLQRDMVPSRPPPSGSPGGTWRPPPVGRPAGGIMY
jgi:hypothetical protein